MAGTDYCDPDVLIAFTDRTEAIAESVGNLLTRLDEARVARGAFGRMPFISDDVHTAYDGHVDDVTLGLGEAQSAVLGAGAGTARCAAEWLQAEMATMQETTQVGDGG